MNDVFCSSRGLCEAFTRGHFCIMLGGLYPAEQGTLKRLMEKKMTEGYASFNDTEKEYYGRLMVKAEHWEVKELQDELKQELNASQKDEEVPPVELQAESAKQSVCGECSIL